MITLRANMPRYEIFDWLEERLENILDRSMFTVCSQDSDTTIYIEILECSIDTFIGIKTLINELATVRPIVHIENIYSVLRYIGPPRNYTTKIIIPIYIDIF